MLRTNSKKAIENIHEYIRNASLDYLEDNFGIDPKEIETKHTLYCKIYSIYQDETRPNNKRRLNYSDFQIFKDWGQGLAMGGLFDFYVHCAKDELGSILEETESEKDRYTETQAEECMMNLIYREIRKEWDKR